jgi:hypothetical protein
VRADPKGKGGQMQHEILKFPLKTQKYLLFTMKMVLTP